MCSSTIDYRIVNKHTTDIQITSQITHADELHYTRAALRENIKLGDENKKGKKKKAHVRATETEKRECLRE